MNGLSGVGLLTSFGAGIVSFLSPCVLPLVPGYVSYVAGDTLTASGEPEGRLIALRLSLCFVLGFSTYSSSSGRARHHSDNSSCPTATRRISSAVRLSSCSGCS